MTYKYALDQLKDAKEGKVVAVILATPEQSLTLSYDLSLPDTLQKIQDGTAFSKIIFDVCQFFCEAGYMPRSDHKTQLWEDA